jgi:hypothetical protein
VKLSQGLVHHRILPRLGLIQMRETRVDPHKPQFLAPFKRPALGIAELVNQSAPEKKQNEPRISKCHVWGVDATFAPSSEQQSHECPEPQTANPRVPPHTLDGKPKDAQGSAVTQKRSRLYTANPSDLDNKPQTLDRERVWGHTPLEIRDVNAKVIPGVCRLISCILLLHKLYGLGATHGPNNALPPLSMRIKSEDSAVKVANAKGRPWATRE